MRVSMGTRRHKAKGTFQVVLDESLRPLKLQPFAEHAYPFGSPDEPDVGIRHATPPVGIVHSFSPAEISNVSLPC
jgi:hypothetical protein